MLAGVRRALPILLVAALGGCSPLGSDDETEPATGDAKRVVTTIQQFDAATRARRYDVICNRLFTKAARNRAGGGNCVKLLTANARDIRRPRISLVSVSLQDRGRAEARV